MCRLSKCKAPKMLASKQISPVKKEEAFDATVHGEIWFKENEAMTTWTKVSSIHGELTPGNLQALNLFEWNPDTAQTEFYPTIDLGQIGDTPVSKTLVWKAGDDAPNINTSNAKIRIIAFYPKVDEFGTVKPISQQTSGWNGEGNFGGSGGSPDGNGSSVDSDGDGFSDDEELAAGSDPYNPSSFPGSNDPASPDGNGSVVDSDGDGFSDEEEINAGSDPYNPASTPGAPGGV